MKSTGKDFQHFSPKIVILKKGEVSYLCLLLPQNRKLSSAFFAYCVLESLHTTIFEENCPIKKLDIEKMGECLKMHRVILGPFKH